jgi:hypothetical protein
MDQAIPYYSDTLGGDAFFNKVKRVFTSAFIFICAFIISYCLFQILIGIGALLLKYGAKISYNVVALTPNDWRYWNLKRVTAVHFTPPVICLILGFRILTALKRTKTTVSIYRLFAFWFSICLVNVVLASLLFAPLGIGQEVPSLYRTFAIIGSWMHLDIAIACVFSIIGITGSILWGLFIRNEVLRYSYSGKLLGKPNGRHSMVVQVYLLPVLLGAFPLVLLSNYNGFLPMIFILGNLLLISTGMFIKNSSSKSTVRGTRSDVLNHFPVIEAAIAALIWIVVFRFFR